MSIELQGPSLLLNSYAFTGPFGGCGMFMDETWNLDKKTKAKDVVNWIGVACKDAPGRRLANVVLNFHGKPGEVHVGEASPGYSTGRGGYQEATFHKIDNDNAGAFWSLRQYSVGTLWFHSCEIAAGSAGKSLCRQIAIAAHCRVVAAEDTQYEWWDFINAIFMPRHQIDDYEG